MPVKVKKVGDLYRVVEASTGKIVKGKSGKAVSKGFASKERAQKQANAINASLKKKGKI